MFRIATIPFDSALKGFDDEMLRQFVLNKSVSHYQAVFFEEGGNVYWSIFLEYDVLIELPSVARFNPLSFIIDPDRPPNFSLCICTLAVPVHQAYQHFRKFMIQKPQVVEFAVRLCLTGYLPRIPKRLEPLRLILQAGRDIFLSFRNILNN
jgi:hypothetical protein